MKWLDRPDLHDPLWSYGLSADGSKLFVSSSDFLVKTHTILLYDTNSGQQQVYYRFTRPATEARRLAGRLGAA